ncbi:MAG: hypothetical protein FWH11_01320 [Micrococcales bacterium]|nr:hypothetical protein [Micrococcales bacterium]
MEHQPTTTAGVEIGLLVRVGDGDPHEIGTAELTLSDADSSGTVTLSGVEAGLADILEAAAASLRACAA